MKKVLPDEEGKPEGARHEQLSGESHTNGATGEATDGASERRRQAGGQGCDSACGRRRHAERGRQKLRHCSVFGSKALASNDLGR